MSEESERARASAYEQIRALYRDADPQIASMGRLLEWVTEWHGEWIADEQSRGTSAADALSACVEAYMMLIHSVMQMACSPDNQDAAEALVLDKILQAWRNTAKVRPGVKATDISLAPRAARRAVDPLGSRLERKRAPSSVIRINGDDKESCIARTNDLCLIKHLRKASVDRKGNDIGLMAAKLLTDAIRAANFAQDAASIGRMLEAVNLKNSPRLRKAVRTGIATALAEIELRSPLGLRKV